MLTVSLENDYRAGQVKCGDSSRSEKQNSAPNFRVVRGPALFGNAVAKVQASSDWSAESSHNCDRAENKVENTDNHLFLSPIARIILREHGELLKAIEMTLLGVIVFSIFFAVTAGL